MRVTTRRRTLQSIGGIVATVLAGCIGDDASHDDEHQAAQEPFDEIGIEEFTLLDRAHDPHAEAAYIHGDHWHGGLESVPLDGHISIGADVEDRDGNHIAISDEFELRAAVAHGADDAVVSFDFHGDHVHVLGESEGATEIVFLLWHDDHAEYQSPAVPVQVGDVDHHHGDDHDHAH